MEIKKVIESLSHWVVASKEPGIQDATILRHKDPKTPWIILLLASGFGAGYSPFAPGTAGTLVAIPLFLVLSLIASPFYEVTLTAFFFLSCWVADKAQAFWGRRDDPRIVIDEMVGFLLTMLWVPQTTLFIALGFFAFRFFDIVKPPPGRRLERLRGGWGVVMDDILAGIYANIVLQIVRGVVF